MCPRIFKAETGNTPIHYLIDIRLTKAYNLLTQNLEMSIQEIAAQVGYEDALSFQQQAVQEKYGVALVCSAAQDTIKAAEYAHSAEYGLS